MILENCDVNQMQYDSEEEFGPIAPLTLFNTEEEVFELATYQSGRAAYFYTENVSRLWRLAEALDTGMVGARAGLVSACEPLLACRNHPTP